MRIFLKKILKLFGLYKITIGAINFFRRKKNILKDEAYNNELFRSHLNLTFGDQKGQVEFLINNFFNYEKNGLPKNGYFVDLAAADGIIHSNTIFLEKYLGWKGILFEPNPNDKSSIESNRTSPLVTDCVSDLAGKLVKFRIDNGQLGGIVGDEFDNNNDIRGSQLKHAEIIEIPTTTLEKELDRFGAPKIIDFMSLDIEGAEYLVLKDFPFSKYKFKCMAIERPSVELDILLDLNGYIQIKHLFYDVIYAHSEFVQQVNLNPKYRFALTPTKNW
jgi:FkbM family methyltransferase